MSRYVRARAMGRDLCTMNVTGSDLHTCAETAIFSCGSHQSAQQAVLFLRRIMKDSTLTGSMVTSA